MLVCNEICLYYETYKAFDRQRTYEHYKRCTRCDHIVNKEEFPDPHCYCCNAIYRSKYPSSYRTRKIARQRKRARLGY